VLLLLRADRSNDEIAEALGVTLATARFHVSEVIGKLGVANRHEAALWRPQPESNRSSWTRAFAPVTAIHIKWSTAAGALGAAVIAGSLVLVALLVWGVGRASTQDRATAAVGATCVRGPTYTPVPTLRPEQRKTPLPPDLRPDSTRMAEIDQSRKQSFESTRALIASGCDPRNLPMVAFSHLDGLPPQTLDEALQRADLVVTAHVTKTAFTIAEGDSSPAAETTLTVDVALKGDAREEITLYQMGGPIAQNGGVIEILKGDPVLLRGDDVLLLAQKRTDVDGYWPLYPVGKYYIRDGRISVPDGSPCDWLDGRSVSDVLRLVRASLAHDTQDAAQRCDWSRF
jgi:hypothetical protein